MDQKLYILKKGTRQFNWSSSSSISISLLNPRILGMSPEVSELIRIARRNSQIPLNWNAIEEGKIGIFAVNESTNYRYEISCLESYSDFKTSARI